MIALGIWLKHLVLIVIVSVIADLLLPTKSMQKYVRAVLGIAIIAAMIQPITPMFRQNWVEDITTAITDEVTRNGAESVNEPSSLTSVDRYKAQLDAQEAAQADIELADATKEALPANLRDHVTNIVIKGANTPAKLQATIDVNDMGPIARQALQKAVADALHISTSQVTVRANGGE